MHESEETAVQAINRLYALADILQAKADEARGAALRLGRFLEGISPVVPEQVSQNVAAS
jgi:hypothetical protein